MGSRTGDYASLPKPKLYPQDPPQPPTAGWWWDPFKAGPSATQRYHDGTQWTKYTSNMAGRLWSDIVERPLPDPTQ
jgi:hypothetical protein